MLYEQFERKERRRRRSALILAVLIHLALFSGIYFLSESKNSSSIPDFIKEWVKEFNGKEDAPVAGKKGQA